MTVEEKPETSKPSLRSEDDILRLYETASVVPIDPEELGKTINSILGDDINSLMKELIAKTSEQTKAVNQAKTGVKSTAKKGDQEVILVDDLVSVGNSQKSPEEDVQRVDEKMKTVQLFQDGGFDDDEDARLTMEYGDNYENMSTIAADYGE